MDLARMKRDPDDCALACRLYVVEGKRWPRLSLSIYPRVTPDDEDAIEVLCAFKRSPMAWWMDIPIPVALVGDACELLREAVRTLGGGE